MATIKELKLLRSVLSQDHTLFTIQRSVSRPYYDGVRVDCFASKGTGSPGLMRITNLVAEALNYRRSIRGLAVNSVKDAGLDLVAALSQKLELDLKHERVN